MLALIFLVSRMVPCPKCASFCPSHGLRSGHCILNKTSSLALTSPQSRVAGDYSSQIRSGFMGRGSRKKLSLTMDNLPAWFGIKIQTRGSPQGESYPKQLTRGRCPGW